MGQKFTDSSGRSAHEMAKHFAELIPYPSSMFTTVIRAVRNGEEALGDPEHPALRDLTANSAAFILTISPSLRAIFYSALKVLHEEQLEKLNEYTPRKILSLFSPTEVTSTLALAYLYRQVKKRCDAAEWERIEKKLFTHMEITALIGRTVNHVGAPMGIFIGGIRVLSQALFAVADLKGFQEHRRKLERDSKLFDTELEIKRWGCSHLDIASILAQQLGFGMTVGMGLAIDPAAEVETIPEELAEILLCWKVTRELSDSFQATGAAPIATEEDATYLPPEEEDKLKKQIWGILRDGAKYNWLATRAKDLSQDEREKLDIKDGQVSTPVPSDLADGEGDSIADPMV